MELASNLMANCSNGVLEISVCGENLGNSVSKKSSEMYMYFF
jgi:hypothetical protein